MERRKSVRKILGIFYPFFFVKSLVWNAEDLSLKKELDFPAEIKEGWGIVKRIEKGGLRFYITNGSDKIYVVDGVTWKILKRIPVRIIHY